MTDLTNHRLRELRAYAEDRAMAFEVAHDYRQAWRDVPALIAAEIEKRSKPAPSPSPTARNLFASGDIVRHLRSGHTYQVQGRCVIEKTLADCYAYRGAEGLLWIRPVEEMEDGRFERVGAEASSDD